ncbi:MAG: DUF1598 domain-containing protein [Planctomycetia bacterium]|nr:DUF1598 domain-containing protein [Planctomycetia bacterium]
MLRSFWSMLLAILLTFVVGGVANAQTYDDNDDSSVGGVMIDAKGLLSLASVDAMSRLEKARRDALEPIAKGLDRENDARKVSLRGINETILRCETAGEPIPDAVRYLGGLTAIEFVFIYPEQNDIVLVGPAEGWTVGPKGVIVGKKSGKPILLLQDLVEAMNAAAGRERPIFSVSIDPSAEGLERMSAYASSLGAARNPKAIAAGMEEALGDQIVKIEGVPRDSHFAYVMAAADYRMKQISMGATKSPLKSLPSFVSMMKSAAPSGALPRWWLAPNYETITRDQEGLSWNLKGGSVLTCTETEFLDRAQGAKGKPNEDFARWAEKMTENYDDLARVEPIFGQLRNCMDCAFVAAIIAQSNAYERVDYAFEAMRTNPRVCAKFENVPQFAPSVSVVARKSGAIMFVTGGVSMNPWPTVLASEKSPRLESMRSENQISGKSWWNN